MERKNTNGKTSGYFVYAYFQKNNIQIENSTARQGVSSLLEKHINNFWSAQQLLDLNFHFSSSLLSPFSSLVNIHHYS